MIIFLWPYLISIFYIKSVIAFQFTENNKPLDSHHALPLLTKEYANWFYKEVLVLKINKMVYGKIWPTIIISMLNCRGNIHFKHQQDVWKDQFSVQWLTVQTCEMITFLHHSLSMFDIKMS